MTSPQPPEILCGGCRERGSCRLGVTSFDVDHAASAVESRVICAPSEMAGHGIAHGGWTAAVFDDVLGRLPLALGERAVTSELQVRYLRPVPIERDLVVRARVLEARGKERVLAGELQLAATDALLASARLIMVVVADGHIERHREWLNDQERTKRGAPNSTAEPVKWADLMDDWQL